MIVAETVPELEAKGVVLCFQLLADLVKFLPGIRELLYTYLGKPIGAPVHQLADIAEGDCLPLAVHERGFLAGVVPTTLCFANVFGYVFNVDLFFTELDYVD